MALTQVKSDGIATGAVTATQIATGAVTANDLEDSGVTAGTYGSSSAIPAITVDAKGRITSASTNSVTQVGGANGVDFNDGVKARFGTGNDLEIYHDGSNSYVKENGAGNLKLLGNNLVLKNSADGETYVECANNGAVSLYYDNSAKLATTSGGINVTGTVTCDGLSCVGAASIESAAGVLKLKDNDGGSSANTSYVEGIANDNSSVWYVGHGTSADNNLYLSNQVNGDINFRTGAGTKAVLQSDGHFRPAANNTYDLGTSSLRWRNIYTNDLNLSNEGGANDVDGTWGNWTIQEGEDDLFLLNRRNGKKYKFNLTEVN